MPKKPKKKDYAFLIYILLLVGFVVIDQLTKWIAHSTQISKDFGGFAFTYVQNTGASFGILKAGGTYLAWISVIVLGLIMYFHDRFPKKARIFLIPVSAGIIGNLLDRLTHGFVIDFINLKVWPVFNIADSLIVIGIIALIIRLWK
ncbi:signal peptidase II [Candidatus Woesearchaeota archaeon]|nr:signal peptidase II [Candidatus Woesearchaeota archaeon]